MQCNTAWCDRILLYKNSFLLSSVLFLHGGSWQSWNQAKKKKTIEKVSTGNSLGIAFLTWFLRRAAFGHCVFNLAPKTADLISQNQLKWWEERIFTKVVNFPRVLWKEVGANSRLGYEFLAGLRRRQCEFQPAHKHKKTCSLRRVSSWRGLSGVCRTQENWKCCFGNRRWYCSITNYTVCELKGNSVVRCAEAGEVSREFCSLPWSQIAVRSTQAGLVPRGRLLSAGKTPSFLLPGSILPATGWTREGAWNAACVL